MSSKASFSIPPEPAWLDFSANFLRTYLRKFLVPKESARQFEGEYRELMHIALRHNSHPRVVTPIGIEIERSDETLLISILNKGIPIYAETIKNFLSSSSMVHENCGRAGQKITLQVLLPESAKRDDDFVPKETLLDVSESELTVRGLQEGEEVALSQLFYSVYGYQYINESIYYPIKIRAMIDEGKLLSYVVKTKDKLIGHVGLLRLNTSPLVYEAGLGIIDPTVKSRGLFKKIFQHVIEEAQKTTMDYCVFDCVTNIDFTQRLVQSYGACDMALFIGLQNNQTQAKLARLGIGDDPEGMDRYSIHYSILKGKAHPFGKEIVLPDNLNEMVGFLLRSLGVSSVPAPRFSPFEKEGTYQMTDQKQQSSVIFDFVKPGRKALKEIISLWRTLLRNGYLYAAVDVPLSASGLAVIHDGLAAAGFFISGFIPYHFSNELAVRFQSIAPTKVAFDQIKVASEQAKKLLTTIQADYERNALL